MQIQPEPLDRILRIKAVLACTGLTRSTLYRKMVAGTFPQNTQISTRCMGWRESAIAEWLDNPMSYDAANRKGG
ncbi:helix-turn-helix transcriptional regulator [Sphingomonas sp. TDK1]|uniref:helix-turn-helix transcriptional regulator n=1 Tax=Sphingomonas sp. TDK1 TaxID=453247 RepID=UPI0007D9F239|nr:AlpA family phage regulatory protein [Sphingomonas sp. TDK1]OAN63645.1 AlpA family transcriptional regulator [Sphingomonas sp. TDK1]